MKHTKYRSNKINKWHVPNMKTGYRSKTINYKFDINKYKLVQELDLMPYLSPLEYLYHLYNSNLKNNIYLQGVLCQ